MGGAAGNLNSKIDPDACCTIWFENSLLSHNKFIRFQHQLSDSSVLLCCQQVQYVSISNTQSGVQNVFQIDDEYVIIFAILISGEASATKEHQQLLYEEE